MNHNAIIIAVFLMAVFLATSAAQSGPQPDEVGWRLFLGNNSDGKTLGTIGRWAKSGPKKVWTRDFGYSYSPPAVSDSKVFHFDRVEDRNRLTCLSVSTGEILWRKEYKTNFEATAGYGNGPRSSPVVDSGSVFTFGPEGLLQCRNIEDGKLKWECDTTRVYGVVMNPFGVVCSPIVEDDKLIVMVGGSPKVADVRYDTAESNGTGIIAFQKDTGREMYRLGDELASYSSPVVKEIHGQRVGLAIMRGGLLVFNPTTGKQLSHFPWRARFAESANIALPVVDNDQIFLTEAYGPGSVLLRLDDNFQPEVVWEAKKRRNVGLRCHFNTPIKVGEFVYGCSGRHGSNAELRCVKWKTGEVVWAQKRFGRCSMTLVGSTFLGLTEDGRLFSFEASSASYSESQSFEIKELKHPCWNAPVIAEGLLFIASKGTLTCFQLQTDVTLITAPLNKDRTQTRGNKEKGKTVGRTDLSHQSITDDSLKTMKFDSSLKELNLFDNSVSDSGLRILADRLPNLESLNVGRNPITDRAAATLLLYRNMKSLDLRECEISDEILTALVELKKLESLSLRRTKVTDQGMLVLSKIRRLRKINLYSTEVSDLGVASISNLPNLEELNLNGTRVTGESFKTIAGMRLTKLSLQYISDFQFRDFQHFDNHKSLMELSLYDTPLDDKAVSIIESMPELKRLDIRMTDISEERVAELRKRRPELVIQY